MQDLIETIIRSVGWLLLKVVTFGHYHSDGQSAVIVEGAVGLLSIAAVLWVVYSWWPS
jgi:hypothetical protein